jgi:hypothetical protein
MKRGHSLKKKDKPKLQRKFQRCVNCNSANVRIGYSIKKTQWYRKCTDCNWVQNYMEQLP